jgi:hypothetical protein
VKRAYCEADPKPWTLRLPVLVERPRDVFNLSVLSVRWVPGRRILLNATPANGLSAPTSGRAEHAECNAPPIWVVIACYLLPRPLKSSTDYAYCDYSYAPFLCFLRLIRFQVRRVRLARTENQAQFRLTSAVPPKSLRRI